MYRSRPRFMPFFLLPALGGQADVRHERDARASGGISRVFAAVKRQTPYIDIMKFAV